MLCWLLTPTIARTVRKHWKHSKLAQWLRGYEKPHALSWNGWDDWEKETQVQYPVRYWFFEEFVPKAQDFLTWPAKKLRDVRYYINNRWITRTHAMTSNLKRGQWHEFETRLLHCMFDELVNFVEIEQAWMQVVWGDDSQYKAPWYRSAPFRLRVWRCPEAGIARLNWAASLDEQGQPTRQALDAKETLALYHWWKEHRPARRDVYEVSGWNDITREVDIFDDTLSQEKKDARTKSMEIMDTLEKRYEREDEEMMIRLVKLRRSLWT